MEGNIKKTKEKKKGKKASERRGTKVLFSIIN